MPATDIERLVVQLSADVRGYQRALDRARAATNKTAGDIESRFNRMNKNVNSQFSKLGSGLRGVPGLRAGLGGIGGALAAREIQKYADSWTEAGNKIAAASQISGRAGRSLEGVNEIAQRSRAGISETATLYARLLQSTAGIAKSEEEVARATETVNKAFAAGGATASEMSAGVLQLSQALGSGALQGDELRSLRENAPLLARAIAQEFNTTIGGLKELGAQGELTSDRIFKAILKGQREIEGAFSKTKPTIAQGFTRVENAFIELIGTFDKATGTTESLSKQLNGLAEIIKTVGENTKEALKQWNEFIEGGSRLANILNTLNAPGANFTSNLERGENPFDRQFFFGGADNTPLNEAKQKVEKLQASLDHLLKDPNATPESIERLKKALAEAIVLANQLQQVFDKTSRIRFGGPATGPASFGFGGGGSGSEPAAAVSEKIVDAIKKGLLEVLKIVEGGKDGPNAVNFKDTLGLRGNVSLVTMTVREVLALQSRMRSDQRNARPGELPSSALGTFQIVGKTLEAYVKKLGISLNENFGPELQEKIASAIIADQVKAAGGNTDKLVELLRGQFEGLKGLSKDQILEAVANSTDAIVKGTESIQERSTAIAEMIAKEQQGADLEKLKASLLKANTGEQEKQVKLQELKNELLQQGIKFEELSPELQAKIVGIAEATGQAAQATEDFKKAQDAAAKSAKTLADAQQDAIETMNQIGQAVGGAFQGFISDLAHGKKLTDALRDSLLQLGESLLNIALDNLFKGGGAGGGLLGSLFGGGGAGSILGGLFHGGGVAGHGGHGRKVPALAFAGAPRYHGGGFAGLQQGEVPAILKRGEIIFPNMDAVRNAVSRQGGGAGGGIVQNNTFVSPSWKAAERSQNQIARTAGASLDRVRRTL